MKTAAVFLCFPAVLAFQLTYVLLCILYAVTFGPSSNQMSDPGRRLVSVLRPAAFYGALLCGAIVAIICCVLIVG